MISLVSSWLDQLKNLGIYAESYLSGFINLSGSEETKHDIILNQMQQNTSSIDVDLDGWTVLDVYNSPGETGLQVAVYQKGTQIVLFAAGQQNGDQGDVEDTNSKILNDVVPVTAFQMAELYKQIANDHPTSEIILSGHSLGASVAKLAGVILQNDPDYGDSVDVYAFSGWGMEHLLDNLGMQPINENIVNIYNSFDGTVLPM